MENLINQKKLEQLLQSHWAEVIDQTQMLRFVLTNAQRINYRSIKQLEIPPKQMRLTVTKFSLVDSCEFEVWAEFSIPKGEGVVVGTHILSLSLSGEIDLKESHGTHFMPESS